jgi:hypothetical protein
VGRLITSCHRKNVQFTFTGKKIMPSRTMSFNNRRKIMPGSCVPDGAKVKVLTIQHNHWGRIFFFIQECIFRIRRIQGKMRSTVWTVCVWSLIRFFPGSVSLCTVQTVDLILPCIRRIRKMHSCIEKKILPQWLCCIVRTFPLAPSAHMTLA